MIDHLRKCANAGLGEPKMEAVRKLIAATEAEMANQKRLKEEAAQAKKDAKKAGKGEKADDKMVAGVPGAEDALEEEEPDKDASESADDGDYEGDDGDENSAGATKSEPTQLHMSSSLSPAIASRRNAGPPSPPPTLQREKGTDGGRSARAASSGSEPLPGPSNVGGRGLDTMLAGSGGEDGGSGARRGFFLPQSSCSASSPHARRASLILIGTPLAWSFPTMHSRWRR